MIFLISFLLAAADGGSALEDGGRSLKGDEEVILNLELLESIDPTGEYDFLLELGVER